MKWNPSYVIFMVGVVPLLVAYFPLKEALPAWGFVTAAFFYLVLIRLFADYLSLKLMANSDPDKRAN